MESEKISKKKYILMGAVTLLAFGAITVYRSETAPFAASHAVSWERISPEGTKFAVSFPDAPHASTSQVKLPQGNSSLRYNELRSNHSGAEYCMTYFKFPRKWKLIGSNSLLGKSLDYMIKDKKGEMMLESKQYISHRGYPALEYRVREGNKEQTGRFVVVGNTFVRLQVNHSLGAQTSSDDFFASFDPFVRNQ